MTASNAYRLRPSRRLAKLRACSLGLAIGLLAVASAASAASPGEQAQVPTTAARTAQAVTVSNIDFRRGAPIASPGWYTYTQPHEQP